MSTYFKLIVKNSSPGTKIVQQLINFRPGTIVGFCNPLLDMTVDGDQDLLNKYDLKNNNAILAEEKHMPLYEELMKNEKTVCTAGGSAQNSLRVAQVFPTVVHEL